MLVFASFFCYVYVCARLRCLPLLLEFASFLRVMFLSVCFVCFCCCFVYYVCFAFCVCASVSVRLLCLLLSLAFASLLILF